VAFAIITLEHHGDVAVARVAVHLLAVDQDFAQGFLKPMDDYIAKWKVPFDDFYPTYQQNYGHRTDNRSSPATT
jgi:hypothetical protein